MILVEVHSGLFDDPRNLTARDHGGWRLITPCGTSGFETGSCPLLCQAGEFADREFNGFLELMVSVLTKAQSPVPWESMTDEQQLHNLGDVEFQMPSGKLERVKLWQFQKRKTAVRVAWCYAGGRRLMLVTQTFLKRQQKTPGSEIAIARATIEAFFQAVESGNARLVDEQGGRAGFLHLLTRLTT